MKCISKAMIGICILLWTGIVMSQVIVRRQEHSMEGTAGRGIVASLTKELAISETPQLNVPFEVTFTIICTENLESAKFGPDYAVTFTSNGAELLQSKEHRIHGFLKKGDVRQYRATMIIRQLVEEIQIFGNIQASNWPRQYVGIPLFLVDADKGLYGTEEQWLQKRIGILGKYNNIESQWLEIPDPAWVETNRAIVEKMRRFEPTLTDSEALCLHQDNYVLITNGIGDPNASDDERIIHLLKAGWLQEQRSGVEGKEMWLNTFMEENRGAWGGSALRDIFRGNHTGDGASGNDIAPDKKTTTTFVGTWLYQDHQYNKTNGLLTSYDVKPVKTTQVGIRAYWTTQSTIFVGWGYTNANGYFAITTDTIPYNATNVHAYPVLYSWGPQQDDEIICVSNPSPSISLWRNPRDTTIWFHGRAGNPSANNVTPGDTCDFEICYPETLTSLIPQPRSGAVNILQTYLHARTFTNPPPTKILRCLWEPGYDSSTYLKFRNNTIDTVFVLGDAFVEGGTDEWDDDVLLEEYGHYTMDYYAEIPIYSSGVHYWINSYPEEPGLAYSEAWSVVFSCRARGGSTTDTILVNTGYGIGGDSVYLWNNIEDPWIGSGYDPPAFEGGPWCEGAVAGALWDLYDSHNENPYPYYPDTNNGFVDVTSDSLATSFDSLWAIFDDYNPPDPPGVTADNCWTIYHFRAGWFEYSYGHEDYVYQILYHHYIADSVPLTTTGLSAEQEENDVRLYWNKNSEPDLLGYRIIRRMYNETWGWWDNWEFLADVDGPNDTTFLDISVISTTYRYRVAAYDSLNNISDYSDSVEIKVDNGIYPQFAPLLGMQTIVTSTQHIELALPQYEGKLEVRVYDCCGRMVCHETIESESASTLRINFRDRHGRKLPCGVYFLKLDAETGSLAKGKFVIVR